MQRHRARTLCATLMASLFLVAIAKGAVPERPSAAVRQACIGDAKTFCSAVIQNLGARQACMNAHRAELSAACKAALEAASGTASEAARGTRPPALSSGSSAPAEGSSLPYGGGGYTGVAAVVRQHNQSGGPFRIEGHCQSSCTMLLAIRNVCVDPNATLLFHAALSPSERDQKPDPARQSRMLNSYNAKLRDYLTANHYLDNFEFHTISGQEIIQKFGYRPCPNK